MALGIPVAYLRDHPADVVVVVGSGMGEWSTLSWSEALCAVDGLVQVDADPSVIGRAYDVREPIVSDAGAFLERLVDATGDSEPTALAARRAAVEELNRSAVAYAKPELDADPTPSR